MHKKGPSANLSFPPLPFRSRTMPYRPAAAIATRNASHTASAPKNRPPAAKSLISPPPNAPGLIMVTIKTGTLTASIPASLCHMPVSGIHQTAAIPVSATAADTVSGILLSFKSDSAAADSRNKNRTVKKIRFKLPPYVYRLTALPSAVSFSIISSAHFPHNTNLFFFVHISPAFRQSPALRTAGKLGHHHFSMIFQFLC